MPLPESPWKVGQQAVIDRKTVVTIDTSDDGTVPATLAYLRRLYLHMVHGGRVSEIDEQIAGISPLTMDGLSARIVELERRDL